MISKDSIAVLMEKALAVRQYAHAPYSHFTVGAALLGDDNTYYVGVNVENASYGLGICAERNAIFSAKTQGMQYIQSIAVVGQTKDVISPCGACRQIIAEFSNSDTIVILGNDKGVYRLYSIEEIIPFAFTLNVSKTEE